MRTWVKGTAPAALLALGVMAMGSGTAFADTIGDHSIGGGNQVKAPIKLPIDISGNAVGVLGGAKASSEGGASVGNGGGDGGGAGGNRTSGDHSILGGNQIVAPITAPINVCGNAVSVFGRAEAGCEGGASVGNGGGGGGAGGNRTSGDHSILGGNQIVAPITAPINACGNAVAVLGKAKAGCEGGASVGNGGGGGGAGGNVTSGRGSILGGNQIIAPITAPINVCGNSVAVLGDAFAGCEGGAKVTGRDRPGWPDGPGKPGWPGKPGKPGKPKGPGKSGYSERGSRPGGHGAGSGWQGPRSGGHGSGPGWQEPGWDIPGSGAGGNRTSGQGSIAGGNQIVAPITAPINACGNVIGSGQAGCLGGSSVENGWGGGGGGAGGNVTSGRGSILGGNQIIAPITAPINVCGNAVAVLGKAFAGCKGGASVKSFGGGGGAGGNRTNGDNSILGGNQIIAPITAPINVCGNAVAVLGDAAAGCLGGAHVGGPSGHPGGNGGGQDGWNGGWNGGGQGGHGGDYGHRVGKQRTSGLMSASPLTPASEAKDTSGVARKSGSALSSLPVVGGVQDAAKLPELPIMGAAQDVAGLPATSGSAQAPESQGSSAVDSVTKLAPSTPLDGVVPLGDVGLMSAAQPVGMTGMNSGSLLALVLGAMAAASATLFATTRRIRLGRK
ncbi:chaplin family protein [Streptosporangium sp. 'caverna']|uniref:chaplin family protein n=1 Tax=Streptosporangium sp. 'caverna' TaxID=2202249 RepID=UPI0013A6EBD0|nr:chaplin family protein [Streptosporangium sp. 'caverna']